MLSRATSWILPIVLSTTTAFAMAPMSNPCAGYKTSQFACDGYCIWNDPDNPEAQKSSSFTTEIVSSIGYVEVTRFGTQDNVFVTFDTPLSSTTPITDLTAVISGFYIEFEKAKTIHEIEIEAEVVSSTIGPCISSTDPIADDPPQCVLSALVTPKIKVDHHGNAQNNITKAFMKVAAIGTQTFNGCNPGVPIIPWSAELSVPFLNDGGAPWTIPGISTDGETMIQNYPFQSTQPLAPIAFFSGFTLAFDGDHKFRKLVVDPDVGTFVPGQGFQTSMVYHDPTGEITGQYQLELESDDDQAVSGSMDVVVMANALQLSPFALPSGTTNWYKPERSGVENKEFGQPQNDDVFNSDHTVASDPQPPFLLRTLEINVPSPISFCSVSLDFEYSPKTSSKPGDFPSGEAETTFSMLVDDSASTAAGSSCDTPASDGSGSMKLFLLGQEPIAIEARPFPSIPADRTTDTTTTDRATLLAEARAHLRTARTVRTRAEKQAAYEALLPLAEQMARLYPGPESWYLLVTTHLGRRDMAAARAIAEQWADAAPKDWRAPFFIGQALFSVREYEASVEPLEAAFALATQPRDRQSIARSLGFVLERLHRLDDALTLYLSVDDQTAATRVREHLAAMAALDDAPVVDGCVYYADMQDQQRQLDDELKRLRAPDGR